jgi:hypothetical protein
MVRRLTVAIVLLLSACSHRNAGQTDAAPATLDMLTPFIADSNRGLSLLESKTLREHPLGDAELPLAVEYVRAHADASSYHLLFAIQARSPAAYEGIPAATRAAVLCAALEHLVYLNDWGHLHAAVLDGRPAVALIALGDVAKPGLVRLLADRRDAPFFGSADATLSGGYRRTDFAYRYLLLILGREPTWNDDMAKRDVAIAALQTELAGRR